MKTRLLIELEHDDLGDAEERSAFRECVLMNPNPGNELILHSNFLGDEVGTVRVLDINPFTHKEADCMVPCRVCGKDTEGHWQGVDEGGSEDYRCCECGTLFTVYPLEN